MLKWTWCIFFSNKSKFSAFLYTRQHCCQRHFKPCGFSTSCWQILLKECDAGKTKGQLSNLSPGTNCSIMQLMPKNMRVKQEKGLREKDWYFPVLPSEVKLVSLSTRLARLYSVCIRQDQMLCAHRCFSGWSTFFCTLSWAFSVVRGLSWWNSVPAAGSSGKSHTFRVQSWLPVTTKAAFNLNTDENRK